MPFAEVGVTSKCSDTANQVSVGGTGLADALFTNGAETARATPAPLGMAAVYRWRVKGSAHLFYDLQDSLASMWGVLDPRRTVGALNNAVRQGATERILDENAISRQLRGVALIGTGVGVTVRFHLDRDDPLGRHNQVIGLPGQTVAPGDEGTSQFMASVCVLVCNMPLWKSALCNSTPGIRPNQDGQYE